jgi:hypothetical protein
MNVTVAVADIGSYGEPHRIGRHLVSYPGTAGDHPTAEIWPCTRLNAASTI